MIRGINRVRLGGPASRFDFEYDSCSERDDVMEPSSRSGEINRGYIRARLSPPPTRRIKPYDCFETSNPERFGPYESHDSGSFKGGRDLLRSGLGRSFEAGFDSCFPNSRLDNEESGWDSSYPSSAVRSGFLENDGRGTFSSCASDFSPPLLKPAPIGSRGRGMPLYLQNKFGGKSGDLGGQPMLRGQGRGLMPSVAGGWMPFSASHERVGLMERCQPVVFGKPNPLYGQLSQGDLYPAQPVSCMKRKMMAPIQPTMFPKRLKPFSVVKETSVVDSHLLYHLHSAGRNQMLLFTESLEEKQRRARREKQKRKREKELEKYGDTHRLAFTCAFCKVRTSDVQEIEHHFGSQFHWETLDHIEKQTKFDKKIIVFLHESMVNKFRKTMVRKRKTTGPESSASDSQQDLNKAVKEEVCLSRVEMIHCVACHTHIPPSLMCIQQHLKSADHQKSKQEFIETQKRESVLTATSIMTNPIVKTRYEKYLKGENPFEEESAGRSEEDLADCSVAQEEDSAVL
ncbi:DBIRD complex subunit ZNF326 isoform X1 [Arapaima gigas]